MSNQEYLLKFKLFSEVVSKKTFIDLLNTETFLIKYFTKNIVSLSNYCFNNEFSKL